MSEINVTQEMSHKIQILRGGAIIAVVLIHNTPAGILQVLCRPFLNFAVGLFLFLGGFLTDYSKYTPYKRIKKVVVPYIVWTIIYAVLYNFEFPERIPVQIIKNLLVGNGAAVMYYVWVYCEFTLLVPMIDKLSNSKWKYWGFVISPIEIIIMRVIPVMAGISVNKYLTLIMGVSCVGWFDYYYLGYLVGNGKMKINIKQSRLIVFYCISIILQFIEGYLYYSKGLTNCGTQMKLSSILTGLIVAGIAYIYIINSNTIRCIWLEKIGNCSFGIFFSHLAIMNLLQYLPVYKKIDIYPMNAVLVLVVSLFLVRSGHKLLGKYSKYLAF